MVREPLAVVRGLAKTAESNGVIFNQLRVNRLSESQNIVRLETDKGTHQHDAVVVAAGVNSAGFARSCGDFLPMAAERGYNLTVPAPSIELNLPLVFADRGIVATQLTSGLRIGGWAEYAHPNRPANQNYFKSMARISKELFPGLKLDHANFWMGNRPSLPDSVPVISRSASANKVFYNCGHGHYGLTHAATSACILTELISGSSEDPKYKPYAITRFSNTIKKKRQ
jgi:D-amino-acid dehydrogenase